MCFVIISCFYAVFGQSIFHAALLKENLSLIFFFLSRSKKIGFLYLTPRVDKSSNAYSPYNLRIVTHENINPEDYSTISINGVTRMFQGETVFTELDRWEQEYRYHYIKPHCTRGISPKRLTSDETNLHGLALGELRRNITAVVSHWRGYVRSDRPRNRTQEVFPSEAMLALCQPGASTQVCKFSKYVIQLFAAWMFLFFAFLIFLLASHSSLLFSDFSRNTIKYVYTCRKFYHSASSL